MNSDSNNEHASMDSRRLHGWLAFLALFVSMAAFQAMVWPRWPTVKEPDQNSLQSSLSRRHDLRSSMLVKPPRRRAELATSKLLRYSFTDGFEVYLMNGRTKQRDNFQAAFIASSNPELVLKNRMLVKSSPLFSIGEIASHPASQTCYVPSKSYPNGYGVTSDELQPLADQTSSGRLLTFLGIRPVRSYECTLVTIVSLRHSAGTLRSFTQELLPTLSLAIQASYSAH